MSTLFAEVMSLRVQLKQAIERAERAEGLAETTINRLRGLAHEAFELDAPPTKAWLDEFCSHLTPAEAQAQRECLHTHDHRHSERDGLSHWYNDPALRPSVIQHSHEHSSTGHHEDSPHAEAQRGEGDD